MSNPSAALKDKFGFGLPSISTSWQTTQSISATNALNSARHNYSKEVHRATNVGLRAIIAELIDARRNLGLDDEAFTEVMEIVLAHYIENQVNSTVENLFSLNFRPLVKLGQGGKR